MKGQSGARNCSDRVLFRGLLSINILEELEAVSAANRAVNDYFVTFGIGVHDMTHKRTWHFEPAHVLYAARARHDAETAWQVRVVCVKVTPGLDAVNVSGKRHDREDYVFTRYGKVMSESRCKDL